MKAGTDLGRRLEVLERRIGELEDSVRSLREEVCRGGGGTGQAARQSSLDDRIRVLNPWFYPVTIRGIAVTPGIGSTVTGEMLEHRARCRETLLLDEILRRYRFRGKSVLDLACNCGYWSARYVEQGATRVVGVEGRELFCRQAELYWDLNDILPPQSRTFLHGNVCDDSIWGEIRQRGPFECALCAGILYHIPDYRALLARIAEVTTEAIIVDTRVGDREERVVDEPGDLIFNAIAATRSKIVPYLPNLIRTIEGLGFVPEVLPVRFPEGPGVRHVDDYNAGRRVAILALRVPR